MGLSLLALRMDSAARHFTWGELKAVFALLLVIAIVILILIVLVVVVVVVEEVVVVVVVVVVVLSQKKINFNKTNAKLSRKAHLACSCRFI